MASLHFVCCSTFIFFNTLLLYEEKKLFLYFTGFEKPSFFLAKTRWGRVLLENNEKAKSTVKFNYINGKGFNNIFK
jgi:hypothetical protein